MNDTLEVLKALAQSTRLRIVLLLAEAELCSCELVEILEISQPAISQHMNVLRQAGLIEERKTGTWVYYRLAQANLEQTLQWLGKAIQEPRTYATAPADDWAKLDKLLAERAQNCESDDRHIP